MKISKPNLRVGNPQYLLAKEVSDYYKVDIGLVFGLMKNKGTQGVYDIYKKMREEGNRSIKLFMWKVGQEKIVPIDKYK